MISIVVPVYNAAAWLHRCIDSLLAQTYRDVEIILVNDGSTDESGTICDEYAQKDARVRVIHKQNSGPSDARNAGLDAAKGEYLLYVDADDSVEPSECEALLAAAVPGVDIVVGGYRMIEGERCTICTAGEGIETGTVYSCEEYIRKAQLDVVVWGNLYRRQFLIDNGLTFVSGMYNEDTEMFPRLYLSANGIAKAEGAYYNYLVREGSRQTGSMTKERTECHLAIYRNWMTMFSAVKDDEAREKLFAFLIDFYLWSARDCRLETWEVPGLDLRFCLRHAGRWQSRVKAVWFAVWPRSYWHEGKLSYKNWRVG